MNKLWEKLESHKRKVVEEYGEENVLGVFLYGSQNYNLDTPESDVDTKAIIIPTFQDLCHSTPVSREIHFDNEEHCEVKDIREIVKMFKKQNINFLEILYTKYCWVNPKYEALWHEYFICHRGAIVHHDPKKALTSICGQALHTIKQNPSDGKKIANTLRLIHFLEKYLAGDSYGNCIVLSQTKREQLLKFKTGDFKYSPDLTEAIIVTLERYAQTDYSDAFEALNFIYNKNNMSEYWMTKGVEALIAKNFHFDI